MKLELFTTYGTGTWQEQFHQTVAFHEDQGTENQVVNLYPEVKFETIEGFGGAITDAAAYVYSLMNEEQKKQLMTTYFSPERMKYGIVRIHMDSCDFSTEMYEAMSDANDIEMKSFSFARTEKYILPMLEDAQKAAGKPLKLMLSPWSPPSFMKTNGQRNYGGSLKPEYRAMWANYICRYIPDALFEAAQIDGASQFQIFGKIVLPLGKPILVAMGLLSGLGYWNDWTNGLYYVRDTQLYGIQNLLNKMITDLTALTQNASGASTAALADIPSASVRMAIAFVAMLPILCLYPFLQKYFTKGIALGAVKG